MKLTFLGATHEVTGSCFLLEACGKNVLIDCGMEQGIDHYINQKIPVHADQVDAVLLTHAHIDHSGNLPLLYCQGFRGAIHATAATGALCNIMLQDSAHIQQFEAEWKNRKRKRKGEELCCTPYTMEDALETIRLFVDHDYNEKQTLYEGIEFRFIDAGHLLGSSSIEVWVTENGKTEKIVFSGDIGNKKKPLIKDPQYISDADYVVMESTYGDRTHDPAVDYVDGLARVFQRTFDRGGNVVIPSFAVGRTQELLYFIRILKENHRVKGHGEFEVYVDSPLANEATSIFTENDEGYFDLEASELVGRRINPLSFKGLKTSISTEESKAINMNKNPKVIISASGMCDAGRIRHHLKHNLWDSRNTILFVGYQAMGSLGRIILDGAPEIKLFGDTIVVKAEVTKLEGTSSHADREGLIEWVSHFTNKPKKVFVVHGDSDVCDLFTEQLGKEFGLDAVAPYSGFIYDITNDVILHEGIPVEIEKKTYDAIEQQPVISRPRSRYPGTDAVQGSAAYSRLLKAEETLRHVIERNRYGSNKDLAKLADQILALVDRWNR